jgi:hypothetical protein
MMHNDEVIFLWLICYQIKIFSFHQLQLLIVAEQKCLNAVEVFVPKVWKMRILFDK